MMASMPAVQVPLTVSMIPTAPPPPRMVRQDRAIEIDVGPSPVGYTEPEGWPIFHGDAGFGNVVLEYPEYGHNEFRPVSELNDEMHKSAIGKPVTNGHPKDLLDEDTARHHVRGAILKSWTEGDRHRIRFYVSDRDLIEAIKAGKVQLSIGYGQDGERKEGVHGSMPYQFIQRKIRVNHLAVEDRARAEKNGRPAQITMDAKPKVAEMKDQKGPKEAKEDMKKDAEMSEEMDMKDGLSEQGMRLLEEMPEEDRVKIHRALKDLYALEEGGEKAEMEVDEEDEDGMDMYDGDMKAKMDMLEKAMMELREDMKRMMGAKKDMEHGEKKDRMSKKDKMKEDRKDSAIDPSDIIARAEARAREAAIEQVTETQARLDSVRKVTEPVGCYEAGNVVVSQMAFVKKMTPQFSARLDAAAKAKDFDAIETMYDLAVETVDFNKKNADEIADALGSRLDSKTNDVANFEFAPFTRV